MNAGGNTEDPGGVLPGVCFRRLLPLVVLQAALTASCGRGDEQDARSASPFAPTTVLVRDPELALRVDALAAASLGGGVFRRAPSNVEPRLQAVVTKATRADLKVLLRHESPTVRGHIAAHVAKNEAGLVEDVEPLLSDKTKLDAIPGPMGYVPSVAGLAMGGLCYSTLPDALELLRNVVARHDDHAVEALGCLSNRKDEHLGRVVDHVLSNPSRPDAVRGQALRIFTIVPIQSQCASIRAHAADEGAASRYLEVAALSRCEDQESLALLDDLSKSASGTILDEAKVALLLHPWTPDVRRSELAADKAILERALPRLEARTDAAPTDAGLSKVAKALAPFSTAPKQL